MGAGRSASDLSSLPVAQSPPKGVTIPYRPKPSSSPVIFAGGQVRPLLCSWGAGWGGAGGSYRAASAPRVPVTHAVPSAPSGSAGPRPPPPAEGGQQGKGPVWEERVLENAPGIT